MWGTSINLWWKLVDGVVACRLGCFVDLPSMASESSVVTHPVMACHDWKSNHFLFSQTDVVYYLLPCTEHFHSANWYFRISLCWLNTDSWFQFSWTEPHKLPKTTYFYFIRFLSIVAHTRSNWCVTMYVCVHAKCKILNYWQSFCLSYWTEIRNVQKLFSKLNNYLNKTRNSNIHTSTYQN